jgi:hypothetical protein
MNEINRLWDKWVGEHNDADVDEIIAYYRKQLAMYDSGVKPKKAEAEQVDMTKILAGITADIKTKQGLTRHEPAAKPVKSGLRRL